MSGRIRIITVDARQARRLPARAVLLKGGHARGETAIDWFVCACIMVKAHVHRLLRQQRHIAAQV